MHQEGAQEHEEHENMTFCSKNLGMVIVMILEKQENHLPKLKREVRKEFHAYSTPSLSERMS
jgi:hypothetical protein